MPDFFGNNQRVSATLLPNRETLRLALRLERSTSNDTLIRIEGKPAGSCFFSNGKAYSPAFILEGRPSDSILMDRKIISTAREMGREAHDA